MWIFFAPAALLFLYMCAGDRLWELFFRHLVPESKLLATRSERRHLFNDVKASRAWYWTWIADILLLAMLFVNALNRPITRSMIFLQMILPGYLAFLSSVFPDVVQWILLRQSVRLRARERLVSLGYAICLHCGYDLRAATSEICSECGWQNRPRSLVAQASEN